MESELFDDYSGIFKGILDDVVQIYESYGQADQQTLNEGIVALQASFDGLMIHGISDKTKDLYEFLL